MEQASDSCWASFLPRAKYLAFVSRIVFDNGMEFLIEKWESEKKLFRANLRSRVDDFCSFGNFNENSYSIGGGL